MDLVGEKKKFRTMMESLFQRQIYMIYTYSDLDSEMN